MVIQSKYGPWYPWTLPAILVNDLSEGLKPWGALALGSLGGLAAAVLGGWEVSRRDAL